MDSSNNTHEARRRPVFTVHSEADEEHGSLAEEIAVRYITCRTFRATRKHTFRRMELLYDIWSIEDFTQTISAMSKLTLGFISAFNERVEPLMNGTIEVEGIELIPTYSHPAETFWRQLKFGEFEVAEMSMSSFLIARSRGADMTALPVFPSRRLFQTELSYHVDSGITRPEDLADKRLGVAEYQQTAALWIRGILEHDFGVSQYKIHWYMERSAEMSHGAATGFKPPAGISFNRIAPNQEFGVDAIGKRIGRCSCRKPLGAPSQCAGSLQSYRRQRRLE
jgi:hypothetical protein